MGNYGSIKVGDIFRVKPDVKVTVLFYHSSTSIIIEDSEGNKRDVTSANLRNGSILWLTKNGTLMKSKVNKSLRNSPPEVGQRYKSRNHGWYEIIEIESFKNMTIKFEDTGCVKSGVFTHVAFTGKVSDLSRPRADDPRYRYPNNSVQTSNSWGNYTILDMQSTGFASIKWHDSGNLQENVLAAQIRSRRVTDTAEYRKEFDYLQPAPGFHYIYMAKLNKEVIYIGQGFGKRYLHCRSGCSHNKELNKLYFAGIIIDVSIHQDNLSKSTAAIVEKQLIELIKPYCNQRRYNVDFKM